MREELEESSSRETQLREKIYVMYASISHDLKTPLATMDGYLEGILYDVVQEPKDIKEYVNRILEKSCVLNKMIDDILEHSKAELNQLSIVKQEVYARDYFEHLLGRYQSEVQQRGLRLSYQLPENVIILLDTNRIAEVFENLIGNSIKYGGESVELEVTFDLQLDTEQILLTYIKDNGPGIDEEDLPFIFDMFYRGNRARTQDIPGSGLGLHISKYIIEQHGGRIECDSIIGIGTTMAFSLPLNA
jgi:signal transduction histidine kinase